METDQFPKIISSVTIASNTNYCRVLLEDGQQLSLPTDLVVQYRLKRNVELDQDLFSQLLKESDIFLAKRTAYGLLTRKPRSERETIERLKEKGFGNESISKAIDFCKNFGLVNDTNFAENFAEQKFTIKKWTQYKIYIELLKRGVAKDISEKAALIAYNPDTEFANGMEFAKRKLRLVANKTPDKQKNAVINHLKSKGFGWETIKKIVSQIF